MEINEDAVCYLVQSKATNSVKLEYVPIKNTFGLHLATLKQLCFDDTSHPHRVLSFLTKNEQFKSLTGSFSYCRKLGNAYEGVVAAHNTIDQYVKGKLDLIDFNSKHGPADYNPVLQRQILKRQIYCFYELWAKAFAIDNAYKECEKNTNVLAYSHRRCGWSSPVQRLTPNFTIEVKSNFGYGSVSYFYIKLTYKEIEILPFSDWVNYEEGTFSEIIRYTQKYRPNNDQWLPAMIYCRDACNLSLTDEDAFITKYIIDECEDMVNGLEKILNEESFVFKDQGGYAKRIKGRALIGFRGDKISGALDFIGKILKYQGFASVAKFVNRIQICNRVLQPILATEVVKLRQELTDLNVQLTIVKPKFTVSLAKNTEYDTRRAALKKSLAATQDIPEHKLDIVELEKRFICQNSDYHEFVKSHQAIVESHRILTRQLASTKEVLDKIICHNLKILSYFNKS